MTTKQQQKQYRTKYYSNPEKRRQAALRSAANTKKWYHKPENRVKMIKLAREHEIKKKLENPIGYMLEKAKSRAKKAGLPFNVTCADIEKPIFCPVFGYELNYTNLSVRGKTKGSIVPPNAASLDRIIPDLGYVKGNVIVVSFEANRLKNNASLQQMKKLYEFYQTLEIK